MPIANATANKVTITATPTETNKVKTYGTIQAALDACKNKGGKVEIRRNWRNTN